MSFQAQNLGNYSYNPYKKEEVTTIADVGMNGKAFHVGQSTPNERMTYDQLKKKFFQIPAGYIIGPVGKEGEAPCLVSKDLQLYKRPGGKAEVADMLMNVLKNRWEYNTINACLHAIKMGGDTGRKHVTTIRQYDHIPNILHNIDTFLAIMKETNSTEGLHADLRGLYNENGGPELIQHWLTDLTQEQIHSILSNPIENTLDCAIRETVEETGRYIRPFEQHIAEIYEYKDIYGATIIKAAKVYTYKKNGRESIDASRIIHQPEKQQKSKSEEDQGLKSTMMTPESFYHNIQKALSRKLGLTSHNWKYPEDKERKISGQIRNNLMTEAYLVAAKNGQIDEIATW